MDDEMAEGAASAGALYDLAEARFRADDLRGAERLLVAATAFDDVQDLVFINLGMVRARLADHEGAVAAYTRALEEFADAGDRHVGLVGRALSFEAGGDIARAEADYRAALHLKPDDIDALVNLGALLIDTDRYWAALVVLQRAHALDPKAGWLLYDVYRELGDLDGAETAARDAVAAGELRAMRELADIVEARGRVREAEDVRAEARKIGVSLQYPAQPGDREEP